MSSIFTKSKPIPWINKTKNEITQYLFSTIRTAYTSKLHINWYKQIGSKYVNILPINIEELLTPLVIAHFIMGYGYYSNSVIIFTYNFTKKKKL